MVNKKLVERGGGSYFADFSHGKKNQHEHFPFFIDSNFVTFYYFHSWEAYSKCNPKWQLWSEQIWHQVDE